MPDSEFVTGMNEANTAFGATAGETFDVLAGTTAIAGTYTATNIDDLVAAAAVAPGGFKGDNTVTIFLSQTTLTASGIMDGTKLLVRGKRVRVTGINYDGDNTPILTCTGTGIKL